MEARNATYLGARARPIFSERDYHAAKRLLSEHAQSLKPFLEAGRFQSLIRELSDYERRSSSTPAASGALSVGPGVEGHTPPQRRWSDSAHWANGHAYV